jgi:hypothetical protein
MKEKQKAFRPKDWKTEADALRIHGDGKGEARQSAECAISSVASNAVTARLFSRGTFGLSDLTACVAVVREKTEQVRGGDLSDLEATLTAQSAALNAIFNEMARRAAMNMNEHLHATDVYLRHAFKAQAQCRATLETLAEIKNPRPLAFVKQANIANGPQQVNNGMPRARENVIEANELSGDCHELLPDARASQVASRVNLPVEAMGEIHRPTNGDREGQERGKFVQARDALA